MFRFVEPLDITLKLFYIILIMNLRFIPKKKKYIYYELRQNKFHYKN